MVRPAMSACRPAAASPSAGVAPGPRWWAERPGPDLTRPGWGQSRVRRSARPSSAGGSAPRAGSSRARDPGPRARDPGAPAGNPGARAGDLRAPAGNPGARAGDLRAPARNPGARAGDPGAPAGNPGARAGDLRARAGSSGARPGAPRPPPAGPSAAPVSPRTVTRRSRPSRPRPQAQPQAAAAAGSGSDAVTASARAGSAPESPGTPAVRLSTKPCPGTTPARRSDSGSACTGRPAALPMASCSNVPGTIRSTQVKACSPDTSRVEPPSVIVHHTAPRRNMTTPSRIGATIPNAGASPDMWPMTQAARRLAIALAGACRSEPTSAARPSSSWTVPAEAGAESARPRGITMTVSPNRPTRPGPGSMPMRVVSCSIVLPLRSGATWAFCHATEQAGSAAEYPGRLRR